jgi:broad specificity phosphatase PhoE
MLTLTYWPHGTTYDNEQGIASGHREAVLSPLGVQQARALGERYRETPFDAIFSSDLQRARMTAELAFGGRGIPLLTDPRLRECDYGGLSGHARAAIDAVRVAHIHVPFPGGESYTQATLRLRSFLADTLRAYDGKRLMVIGHSATLWGLLVLARRMAMEEAMRQPLEPLLGSVYEMDGPLLGLASRLALGGSGRREPPVGS